MLSRLAEWKKVEKTVAEALTNLDMAKKAKEESSERAARQRQVNDSLDGLKHKLGILETQMRQSDSHRLRSDLEKLKVELGAHLLFFYMFISHSMRLFDCAINNVFHMIYIFEL